MTKSALLAGYALLAAGWVTVLLTVLAAVGRPDSDWRAPRR